MESINITEQSVKESCAHLAMSEEAFVKIHVIWGTKDFIRCQACVAAEQENQES